MKILVIDDEKPTLAMFKLFLAAYGYDVFTAQDGESGLALLGEQQPEIVFTDIKMPGMDGIEVLKRIRETRRHCQVVIITGHGDLAMAIDALDLGASDFINKPLERQALNAALTRAEKRMALPQDLSFRMAAQVSEQTLILNLYGKLTVDAGTEIRETVSRYFSTHDLGILHFEVDDSFSIDKSGITFLTDYIRQINLKGVKTVIGNLSYNFKRVFMMAGIDKMAVINEAAEEE